MIQPKVNRADDAYYCMLYCIEMTYIKLSASLLDLTYLYLAGIAARNICIRLSGWALGAYDSDLPGKIAEELQSLRRELTEPSPNYR